jgi:hypothetical protein
METEAQQLLLQLLWAKQVFKERDLQDLFKKVLQNYQLPPNTGLELFIRDINKNLEIMGLEIRRVVDEEIGTPYWGLANTRNDDLAKIATFYTPEQVILFKFIIEKLFVDNIDGELSKIDANNLRIKIEEKQMTVSKADETIQQLINDQWLKENEGTVSLGIRSFLELKAYIEEVYKDYILECIMCQELVIKGQRCSNNVCSVRMHNHCAHRWFESSPNNNCPTCTNAWHFPEGFVVRKVSNRPQIPVGAAIVDIRQ